MSIGSKLQAYEQEYAVTPHSPHPPITPYFHSFSRRPFFR